MGMTVVRMSDGSADECVNEVRKIGEQLGVYIG